MRNVLQAVIAMLLIEVCLAPTDSFAATKSWPESRQMRCSAQVQFADDRIADQRMVRPNTGIGFGMDIHRAWIFVSSVLLRHFIDDATQPDIWKGHQALDGEQPLCAPMGIDDVPALDGSSRRTNPALTGN